MQQIAADALAQSLSELTSGWTVAPGVDPRTLTAARLALAGASIALGPGAALRITAPNTQSAVAGPALKSELQQLAEQAHAAAAPTMIAVVRTPGLAGPANPTGVPDWARGGEVIDSYGPFQDAAGGLHWVDQLPITTSAQIGFAGAAAPLGVLPVTDSVLTVLDNELTLGAGSVWFLASLLGAAFPAGAFTGFTITGGTMACTKPLVYQNDTYEAPTGSTLILTATLGPAQVSGSGGSPDAAAAAAQPPIAIVIEFTASTAVLKTVGASGAIAYGTNVNLQWTGGAPTMGAALPEVEIPCTALHSEFTFAQVLSEAFAPSGSAPITEAAWTLPLAATAITALPEAAGPGAARLSLGTGATLTTGLLADTIAVAGWVLEIASGVLLVLADSAGTVSATTLSLWPEAVPPGRFATLEFDTVTDSAFVLTASTTAEITYTTGALIAHLDRPLDSAGTRIPFTSQGDGTAALVVLGSQASALAIITATTSTTNLPELSLTLENALLHVDSPSALLAWGTLVGTQMNTGVLAEAFNIAWILPTLPDPYAATFETPLAVDPDTASQLGRLTATINWDGSQLPQMTCALQTTDAGTSPSLAVPPRVVTVNPQDTTQEETPAGLYPLALLDLSTNVDLFGVAIAPPLGQLALTGVGRESYDQLTESMVASTQTTAAPFGVADMTLVFNGADVAVFALPQVTWESVEAQAPPDPPGSAPSPPVPIPAPGSDGPPLLLAAPDNQQLVAFAPQPVLTSCISNVAAGTPFAAVFSLPFGLAGVIAEPNAPPPRRIGRRRRPLLSQFLSQGGTFTSQTSTFPLNASAQLSSAVSLTLAPTTTSAVNGADPMFAGFLLPAGQGYLNELLGQAPGGSSSVKDILIGEFGPTPPRFSGGVPLARIDFSGYGTSIFSEWLNGLGAPPKIIKVQFETTRGRTAYEVIQAQSVIYPYCVSVVRTITMQRRNAGWVLCTDSGWQPVSSGLFQVPTATGTNPSTATVHLGALSGAFNVRNIAERGAPIVVDGLTYQGVSFDADLGVANVKVSTGGVPDEKLGTTVPSQQILGYVQLLPVGQPPTPQQLSDLVSNYGPFTPAVSFTAEVGNFGTGAAGTVLRCSAFEVAAATTSPSASNPPLGVALRGAPQIPRGGGWSMGVRNSKDQAPSSLPDDFPVPVVQNNSTPDMWNIADVADIDSLQQPARLYSLIHATGTNKVLFEAPQIPATALAAGNSAVPGLQFPQISTPAPGGFANPGSPNLGDLASILGSSGLFPSLNSALSLFEAGDLPQIQTMPGGIQYAKNYTFPVDSSGNPTATSIVDLSDIIVITLVYADTTQSPPTLATLDYAVDSTASPSWTLSLGPLSAQVIVPAFSKVDPVLTITGSFYADEHTKAGLTNLNVTFGSALALVKNVFSDLQALASYLPGGVGANLDVSASAGQLTVSDTFTVADLPLGLGDLTDVSLDLGLDVTLSPQSVNFLVGLGSTTNPFNWIATPLAGNGFMNFGVQNNLPAFAIQAGIGLGCTIDLAIASGSAAITVAVDLDVTADSITLVAILTGQASVDVLDGLASLSITLSASLGFELTPVPIPQPQLNPPELTIPAFTIDLLASCSVGIHISICWVVNVDWEGYWQFEQGFTTPSLTVAT